MKEDINLCTICINVCSDDKQVYAVDCSEYEPNIPEKCIVCNHYIDDKGNKVKDLPLCYVREAYKSVYCDDCVDNIHSRR